MNHMFSSNVAFMPSVKAVQARRNTRPAHVRIEERGGFRTEIADDLRGFIAEVDTAFLGTANAEGQPHVPEGYPARPEQAILFTVEAWDTNCPQHIPQKFDAADVAELVQRLQARVAELETEVKTPRVSILL